LFPRSTVLHFSGPAVSGHAFFNVPANLQMTIILILVSTTYILYYLPILVHFVLMKMKRSGIVDVEL